MKTVVVNLVGGQGAGKSSMMFSLAGWLKWRNVEVEISPEFAKECVWENRKETFKDELYITSKQNHRIERLNNKVKVIVTDRPLIMSIPYMKEYGDYTNEFKTNYYELIRELNKRYNNLYIYLNRVKPYNSNGRNESEDKAMEFDKKFKNLLEKENVMYSVFDGCESSVEDIGQLILNHIKEK